MSDHENWIEITETLTRRVEELEAELAKANADFTKAFGQAVESNNENLRLREQAGEMAEQIQRLQRELTEAKVRSGELGVGALIATSPAERIIAAGTSPAELSRDLEDAATEDGYDGPVT